MPRVLLPYLDGELVVTWGGRVPLVKFAKFAQAAWGEVVKELFGPVFLVQVVKPSNEVEDVAPFFSAAHNLVDIVLLALLDIVGFVQDFTGVRWSSEVAGLVWFDEQDLEDIVDLLFLRESEPNGERYDDFLSLEGAMILVVQLPGRTAGLDVPSVKDNQVADLVFGGLLSIRIRVLAHSLLCCLQTLTGFLVHSVHPVHIDLTGGVQRIFCGWVGSRRVESVVGVEWRKSSSGSYRIVVCELCHGQ